MIKVTKEEMAALLDGRQYREEMSKEMELLAKESGLVVVFGASDDLVQFRGCILDEMDIYEGGWIFFRDGQPTRRFTTEATANIYARWEPTDEYAEVM